MKRFFTSTALVLSLASAGWAQSVQTEVGTTKMSNESLLVRDLLGEPVYNFRGKPKTDKPMPVGGVERFEKIANVKDLMINADGEVEALILSVGGFWGLADREVTADMDGVTVVTDVRGRRYLVIFTDEETLSDAPRFNKFDISAATGEGEGDAEAD